MNAKYNNFIGMYDNVFPDGYCRHMIDEFERFNSQGMCINRKQSENANKVFKNDTHMFLNMKNHQPDRFQDKSSERIFLNHLQVCFDDYVEEYDILKGSDLRYFYEDAENDSGCWLSCLAQNGNGPSESTRGLVYSVYLNTLDEDGAGETGLVSTTEVLQENTIIWIGNIYMHIEEMLFLETLQNI